ncbi:hypothetical protein FF011L_07590 [Roseimaritima multifibrata]|uniref:DUF3300 domain-containing protein n=1 Tax=Roseimaritima multifibrata TaxID=1930274 RepID=A0A517MAW6_9BACT|nr:DUF3300 domain-containing protein [Roseimaritima multifibrata]QDS92023.1 hypothetical protein FF011L_07590 [Roseimaritima multifibrata]
MLSHFRKPVGASTCFFASLMVFVVNLPQPVIAQTQQQLPVTLLSAPALDALVASNAFYSDQTVEHILQAAQDPSRLHQAATGNLNSAPSESILYLTNYPDLLQQLDQQLPLTTRLGIAARTQIQDVWAAIDRVRAGFQAAQANGTIHSASTNPSIAYVPVATAYVSPAYGYYTAALWGKVAVHELQEEYQLVVNSQASQGNTTITGIVGAGAVSGPNGNTVYGAGGAGASLTSTASGYQVESAAAGAVVNPATGDYAAGAHTGSGSTQQNADGTIDFDRSGSTSTQSSYGSSSISHQSSGTAGGVGNSSYNGSTDVSSTHGNVSTTTEAGDGQVSTTLTTDQGSQTFTGGDGSVGSGSQPQTENSRDVQTASTSRSENRPFSREAGAASRANGKNQRGNSQRAGASGFARPTASVHSGSHGGQLSRSQRSQLGSSSLSGRSGNNINQGGRSSSGRSGGGRSRSGGGRR